MQGLQLAYVLRGNKKINPKFKAIFVCNESRYMITTYKNDLHVKIKANFIANKNRR